MIPDPHFQVISQIVAALQATPIQWVITGSTGMALQGVPVQAHDIDLQTDRAGAYAIQQALADFVVTPVRYCVSQRIRSHLGSLALDGIPVEIMGEIQKRLDDGIWEEPVDIAAHRSWVQVGQLRVPVLSLEYEYQAYLKLGRTERAQLIWTWLHI